MLHKDAFAIPAAPMALTVAGLMPFFGGAAGIAVLGAANGKGEMVAVLMLIYAATILSFLGGVRWGIEIIAHPLEAPKWSSLTLSVAGALGGWVITGVGLLNHQIGWALLAMAIGLSVHWLWDTFSAESAPAWYPGLRTLASAGAVTALIIAAALIFVAA